MELDVINHSGGVLKYRRVYWSIYPTTCGNNDLVKR
jgi:hypothetical protein